MFSLLKAARRAAINTLMVAVLCVCGLSVEAVEAGESLVTHPTAEAAHTASQTGSKARRRRMRRRTRRSSARRVAGKPREIQGVIVDSSDNMSAGISAAPAATPTPRPRRPISGGILNGKAISLPSPPYPPVAKAARASGTVVVQVLIDENGNVVEARAISGHPLLQAAARDAAMHAKFSPTQLSGQPVKVTGVVTYNFVP